MTREEYLREEVKRSSRQFVGGSWARKIADLRTKLLVRDPKTYREWDFVKKNLLITDTDRILSRQFRLCPSEVHAMNIFEFGGGLLRRSEYTGGQYFAFDLPEMIALQRYIAVREDIVLTSDLSAFLSLMRDNSDRPTAFFATWSLSECPISIRDMVLASAAEHCDLIFLAYQPVYDLIDNHRYFEAFAGKHSEFAWTETSVEPPLDAGAYLVGRRDRWTS